VKKSDMLLSPWKDRLSALLTALSLVALAGGCSGGGEVAPVSGRVTLGGQPLAGAVVTFQPMKGEDAPMPTVGMSCASSRPTSPAPRSGSTA
jgi:hypothetical protein